MRLKQKKQIMEFINTIEEGIDYLSYSGKNSTTAMIQDCNDGLMFLSNLMGEEQEVSELVQKAIHTVQSLIPGEQDEQIFITRINLIKEIMNDVRSIIKNNVKTELEIAFMPYKVSMWDSLESIYREAEKDPNCTCYVVPIPYYEKDAQGQIIRFCYEGNQLPKDIKITPFEMYEFENRQPDIIYIHNPFDQYNSLTMVNPRFYSDNLAQYTDMLVYVPYYVAGSSEKPDIYVMPSYKNATKIIVQSENLKDAYVANGTDADKILVLGSPKVDAMLATLNEPREIPLYWKETIKNKRVFLFNTGIADILSIDTWFEQTELVLNYFMDHENYTLIWRPHPLTELTIKTLRPRLLEAFEKIENKLKQATNIIIDNNGDTYPAVAVSDAIISDYSSVMLQYIITEKPVLGLLSKTKLEKDKYYFADYLGCYFTNQEVSVSQFVDMVTCNEDFKKEERISRFINSISNADGTCGQVIHRTIKNEVINN
ncbi:CDP-glycerol glycerophosphotransferase family protein [Paenibacillus sp. ACRRX]|uniref:CDP-glycerol glycerophosphotransferase family protein n=1 Tax=Paenibacillus sp. ACRRX TaxID=2918206 RepID=UPI001EF623B4|nr:CDP-glycerol glycerophosphotransferase family protein [Paenibacillus sp. ACRRX]MCG7408763.1 CDP-glycerol glycerophosphotransferase family protein [Paenibacillus sp. ACRRX]